MTIAEGDVCHTGVDALIVRGSRAARLRSAAALSRLMDVPGPANSASTHRIRLSRPDAEVSNTRRNGYAARVPDAVCGQQDEFRRTRPTRHLTDGTGRRLWIRPMRVGVPLHQPDIDRHLREGTIVHS